MYDILIRCLAKLADDLVARGDTFLFGKVIEKGQNGLHLAVSEVELPHQLEPLVGNVRLQHLALVGLVGCDGLSVRVAGISLFFSFWFRVVIRWS